MAAVIHKAACSHFQTCWTHRFYLPALLFHSVTNARLSGRLEGKSASCSSHHYYPESATHKERRTQITPQRNSRSVHLGDPSIVSSPEDASDRAQ
ncbi:hypothetical protein ACOMHN_002020 [Nucella lapillus]